MTNHEPPVDTTKDAEAEPSPAARRALAEAAARRKAYDEMEALLPPEKGGRGGRDPIRYGDWEIKGRTSDF